MMADVLRELTARRAADAAGREKEAPFSAVMRRVEAAPPPRPFRRAFPRGGTNVIAELKKASPSEGLFSPFSRAFISSGDRNESESFWASPEDSRTMRARLTTS